MQSEASRKMRQVQSQLIDSVLGEKIHIRPVEESDLPLRVEWINNPIIQRTLNFDYPFSLAKARVWLQTVVKDPLRRDMTIVLKQENLPIGFGGFLNIDLNVRKAELYIAIGDSSYWGTGHGRDGYELITRYGFLELGLNRIYGYQLTFNLSAMRQVENLGWVREGVLRQDVLTHGELKDRAVVSILREEWMQRRTSPSGNEYEQK
jgi:RimJ/RimL family protein N-acetyltransferase